MIHKINGEIFMVGVIDLTMTCLSSVYLYYNPKFEFLSPGTLSALREIEFIKQANISGRAPATLKFYYMGLYYQEC
jgi:arginine-tRNA-protein transferase